MNLFESTIFEENFEYHSDTKTVSCFLNGNNQIKIENDLLSLHDKISIDIPGNEEKFLIRLNQTFFHSFMDSLSTILYFNYKKPQTKIYILLEPDFDYDTKIHNFILQAIKDLGINHKILIGNLYTVNNFYIMKEYSLMNNVLKRFELLKNTIQFYIKNKNVVPFRKVYISRRLAEKTNRNWQSVPGSFFKDDKRLDDEKLVEEYFASLGFEIVYAENFTNYIDQINFFNEAKILIGITGNNLLNGMLMQEGTHVFEMSVPMASMDNNTIYDNFDFQMFYFLNSALNKQLFSSIFTMRKSGEVINFIENNASFKRMLSS